MPMVSYAQNGEDVVLARVFGDRRAGFYVDVGAGHPVVDSVTKHFYDLGWRGINVEPLAEELALLSEERPRDVNVGTALAESTLQAVLDAYADAAIDFLRIDVEGHEEQVLRGVDLGVWRPRVVVVEATLPSSTVASHEAWEPLLVSHGYEHRLFDGLNRFYVREEDRDDLGPALSAPANVLDDFVPFRFSTDQSEARARRAEAELHAAQDTVDELRDELGCIERAAEAARGVAAREGLRRVVAEKAAAEAAGELEGLRGTATFRYTAELRRLYGSLRRPAGGR